MTHVKDQPGPAVPLPSELPIGPGLIEAMAAAPRFIDVTFLPGERTRVLVNADAGRFEVELPAVVRGRVIVHLVELAALERERPLVPSEVVS